MLLKKLRGRHYAYKQASYREGGQVRTKTIDYLGAVSSDTADLIKNDESKSDITKIESLIKATQQRTKQTLQNDEQPLQPKKEVITTKKLNHTTIKKTFLFLVI